MNLPYNFTCHFAFFGVKCFVFFFSLGNYIVNLQNTLPTALVQFLPLIFYFTIYESQPIVLTTKAKQSHYRPG